MESLDILVFRLPQTDYLGETEVTEHSNKAFSEALGGVQKRERYTKLNLY